MVTIQEYPYFQKLQLGHEADYSPPPNVRLRMSAAVQLVPLYAFKVCIEIILHLLLTETWQNSRYETDPHISNEDCYLSLLIFMSL